MISASCVLVATLPSLGRCTDNVASVTTLVLQAHPRDDSYNAALLDAVVSSVANPRVVRVGQGDVLAVESFDGVRSLVAVYPTWWGSLPASLLEAVNNIAGPWVDGPQPVGACAFATVQSITAVTSHGSSRLVNQLQGEPGRQLWKRTILPLCAPGATFTWRSLYKLDRATAADRARFLSEISEISARTDLS